MNLGRDMEVINNISKATGVNYSDEQMKILQHRGGMCILACAGSGKALKNGTGVLTDKGFVPIETLRIGDFIYDENGCKQIVNGVFPQGMKKVYEVEFSDGNISECCNEHLWSYSRVDSGSDLCTNSLQVIIDEVPLKVEDKNGELVDNIRIPVVSAVEFKGNVVDFPAYTHGYLYGLSKDADLEDGLNDTIVKELLDKEVIEKWDIRTHEVENNAKVKKIIDNVFKMKRFPKGILYSSGVSRAAFCKGYIDSKIEGGYTANKFVCGSKEERKHIDFLLSSLGCVVKKEKDTLELSVVYGKYMRTLYSGLGDKKEEIYKTIVDIRETDRYEEMTCIKVSNKNGLFVAEGFIVTHNTTVLTHLLAKRIMTGEIADTNKLLCTTYSRAGSKEMEDRLKVLFGKLGITNKVQVKTMHASYYQVLKHFNIIKGNVCTNTQRTILVNKAVRGAGVRLEDEDVQLVDSLLAYQVNNLLTDSGLVKSYVYTLEDVPLEKYSLIRKLYSQYKMEEGLIDFDDMQMYMYMLLVHQKNREVTEFCRGMWKYFFIDEFQDISKIQFEILRQLVTDPNNLMVIGDDDQCIYQWRGADPNIILNICGYYDIEKFVLSTNYRCGGRIVEQAAIGIKNNVKRSEKQMVPFNKGGSIKVVDTNSNNIYEMSKVAHKYIRELINDKGVRPSKIAILARNNQHLSVLNSMLFKDGIFSESAPEMKLANVSLYKDLRGIMNLVDNPYSHVLVSKHMWKLCRYLGAAKSKVFTDLMEHTGCDLRNAIAYVLRECVGGYGSTVKCNYKMNISTKLSNSIEYRLQGLGGVTEDDLYKIYTVLGGDDDKTKVLELIAQYYLATEFTRKSNDRTRIAMGIVDYITVMIEKEGLRDTVAFLNSNDQYELGKVQVMEDKLTLSTMHGAKGREWEYVVLFASDNIAFPSFEGINNMIRDGIKLEDISGSIDEDRRLNYVGWTRAKNELLVISDSNNPSVYMMESLGILKRDNEAHNMHIIRMVKMEDIPRYLLEEAYDKIFSKKSEYYSELGTGSEEKEVESGNN